MVITTIFSHSTSHHPILPEISHNNSHTQEISHRQPVALTPVIMKCFERLVLHHIKAFLPPTSDLYKFTYGLNRPSEDVPYYHTALSHLKHQGSYFRMLYLSHAQLSEQTVR